AMAQVDTPRPELHIVSAVDNSGGIRLVVADNGPGLEAPALERLFDSFFTTKPTGMGMGLPICRSILEPYGGTIAGANAPELGAVFTIVLPAAEEPPQ
ncbi:MAG: sensor histidine kinase, partial [Brevundimonas sp.]|nr:sensor histidine kinase [Brevundimonas sp.]